ncbi:MAG: hypothetical protein AVO35_00100 [Candidatus Aegiribacteria sp. MLS_C]|nr:MAG: hypothetical protein AVO35_00100 [Candidatus Aegiribacteria sp. MLS_C]
MGLRDTKKERSGRAILEAAGELFFRLGYGGTKVQAVAEKAGVAVGTIYNYFESKSSLMLAVAGMDMSGALEGGFSVMPSESGLEAITRFAESSIGIISRCSNELLRELLRETAGVSHEAAGSELLGQGATMVGALTRLLEDLAGTGRLRRDLDPAMAALVIYGILTTSMIRYAADPRFTAHHMTGSVRGMLRTLYTGLEPKGDSL